MEIAVKKADFFSEDQYLQFESTASTKNEYWFGEILAMSGARVAHNIIAATLTRMSGAGIKVAGKDCHVFAADMRLRAEVHELEEEILLKHLGLRLSVAAIYDGVLN